MVGDLNAVKKSDAYVDSEGVVPIIDGSDGMAYIPAVVKHSLGSFKEDHELMWEFSATILCMLLAMQHACWLEDRMEALAGFWGNLMSHLLWVSIHPLASKTLLLYQAEKWEAWHLELLEAIGCNLADISSVSCRRPWKMLTGHSMKKQIEPW
ncbi:hypothetical protein M422DRAFT_248821 [Sphaerobolus stellatus SS14]|nr:hypothetical protein M422DRAFT_248821 [Sphaerobolus stellatus SS14]